MKKDDQKRKEVTKRGWDLTATEAHHVPAVAKKEMKHTVQKFFLYTSLSARLSMDAAQEI